MKERRIMKNKYIYEDIVNDIINNEVFLLTKNDIHHGTNKYDHLIRVSKLSYKLSKFFNLDVVSTTRGAILHDFFIGTRKEKEENSYLSHPLTALKNAKEYFNINRVEEDVIKCHMLHLVLLKKICPFIDIKEKASIKDNLPTYKESWIVSISDLLVSLVEMTRFEPSYIANMSLLIIMSIFTIKW